VNAVPDVSISLIFDQLRLDFGLSLEDFWGAYFALGGRYDLDALTQFLEGRLGLPEAEVDILAAVIGDLETTRASENPLSIAGLGDLKTGDTQSPLEWIVSRLQPSMFSSPTRLDTTDPPSKQDLPVRLEEIAMELRGSSIELIVPRLPEEGPMGANLIRVGPPTSQWESHPIGDELVVLLSGAARIVLDHDESNFRSLQDPFSAFVVPRGRWHRHDGIAPETKLLYLTPQGVL
jgi:hypothetical protein